MATPPPLPCLVLFKQHFTDGQGRANYGLYVPFRVARKRLILPLTGNFEAGIPELKRTPNPALLHNFVMIDI